MITVAQVAASVLCYAVSLCYDLFIKHSQNIQHASRHIVHFPICLDGGIMNFLAAWKGAMRLGPEMLIFHDNLLIQ